MDRKSHGTLLIMESVLGTAAVANLNQVQQSSDHEQEPKCSTSTISSTVFTPVSDIPKAVSDKIAIVSTLGRMRVMFADPSIISFDFEHFVDALAKGRRRTRAVFSQSKEDSGL